MGPVPTHRKQILAIETLQRESTKNSCLEEDESSSRAPMTPCGKNRKSTEATGLSTNLSTKHINIETWNVRTICQTGKTAQVAVEMTKYKLALLSISETR